MLGDGTNLLLIGKIAKSEHVSHVYVREAAKQAQDLLVEFLALNDLSSKVTLLPEFEKVDSSLFKHEIGVIFAEPHFNGAILPWHTLRLNTLIAEARHFLPQPSAKYLADKSNRQNGTDTANRICNSHDSSTCENVDSSRVSNLQSDSLESKCSKDNTGTSNVNNASDIVSSKSIPSISQDTSNPRLTIPLLRPLTNLKVSSMEYTENCGIMMNETNSNKTNVLI